jgi:hypothetical protein
MVGAVGREGEHGDGAGGAGGAGDGPLRRGSRLSAGAGGHGVESNHRDEYRMAIRKGLQTLTTTKGPAVERSSPWCVCGSWS